MAPKRRTSSGTMTGTCEAISSVRNGQNVTIKGKIMTKSSIMKSAAGGEWCWVEIKDTVDCKPFRVKAWGKQAKTLSAMDWLKTYDFHGLQCKESQVDSKLECGMLAKSVVQVAHEQLDEEDNWDCHIYGALTEIAPGALADKNLHFIVKLVKIGEESPSLDEVSVDFMDDEDEVRTFNVHGTLRDQLKVDKVYIIHRAKIIDNLGNVDAWSMLTPAPLGYVPEKWTE